MSIPLGIYKDTFYLFGVVTGPGMLGPIGQLPASSFSVDWSNDGTPAAAGTYCVIGSSDAIHWHNLSGTLSFTANGSLVLPASGSTGDSFSIANKPYQYLAILILTYTAGDGTTAVAFRYTRGS